MDWHLALHKALSVCGELTNQAHIPAGCFLDGYFSGRYFCLWDAGTAVTPVQYMGDLAALAWSGLRKAKYLLDGEVRDYGQHRRFAYSTVKLA